MVHDSTVARRISDSEQRIADLETLWAGQYLSFNDPVRDAALQRIRARVARTSPDNAEEA